MDEKKYTLTKEEICFHGRTLYRIKALKDFGDVKRETLVVGLRKRKTYLKRIIVGYMTMPRYLAMPKYVKRFKFIMMLKFLGRQLFMGM